MLCDRERKKDLKQERRSRLLSSLPNKSDILPFIILIGNLFLQGHCGEFAIESLSQSILQFNKVWQENFYGQQLFS